MTNIELLVLNLPNPPNRKVTRDYAGGFGTATSLPRIRRKQSGKPYLNLFLPYSAAVAQQAGFEYKVLDAQALKLSKTEILQYVKKFDPNIAFSMISLPSIYEDKKLLSAIKEELSNTLVVACGSVCNVVPEEVLKGSNIDLVARDSFPYVNSLHTLLKNFKKSTDFKKLPGFAYIEGNKVRINPSKPPEKEFVNYSPIYDILPLNEYEHITTSSGKKSVHVPILGSKGCPYPCSYCPYPLGFGRKTVFKDPKSVVDEIEHLNQIGVEYFDFRNQSFTLNQKWAKAVCREIIERKLEISWLSEARVDETSMEILSEMYSAGCKRINYGVETGDPSLIGVGKPGVLLQNTKDSFKAAREIGIWRHAHMILGLPGENRKTLEETFRFLLSIDPDSVTLNFATPYPGTKMYEVAERNNWIITHDWRYYSSFDVVMVPPNVNAEELYRMAWRIEKNLLLRKANQRLLGESKITTIKRIVNQHVQIVMTYFRFRSKIQNTSRMI